MKITINISKEDMKHSCIQLRKLQKEINKKLGKKIK